MEAKTSNGKKETFSIFRPVEPIDGERQRWPKVGVAFENRDGSINIVLNETIESGVRLQLRKAYQEKKA